MAEYFFNILLCGRSCEQKISDARGRRGEISMGESAVSREIAGADENQGRCLKGVNLVFIVRVEIRLVQDQFYRLFGQGLPYRRRQAGLREAGDFFWVDAKKVVSVFLRPT